MSSCATSRELLFYFYLKRNNDRQIILVGYRVSAVDERGRVRACTQNITPLCRPGDPNLIDNLSISAVPTPTTTAPRPPPEWATATSDSEQLLGARPNFAMNEFAPIHALNLRRTEVALSLERRHRARACGGCSPHSELTLHQLPVARADHDHRQQMPPPPTPPSRLTSTGTTAED